MMQYLVLGAILLAAAVIIVRHLYRLFQGRSGCACHEQCGRESSACDACPDLTPGERGIDEHG